MLFVMSSKYKGKKEPILAIRCASRRFFKMRDGPTDGRTDGRTDGPTYRDARTHLKIENFFFLHMLDLKEQTRHCVCSSEISMDAKAKQASE